MKGGMKRSGATLEEMRKLLKENKTVRELVKG